MFAVKVLKNSELEAYVNDYKTVPAKKGALTREIKACTEHLDAVTRAYERRGDKAYGYYLGDRIFKVDLRTAENNLKTAERFRANL